MPLAIIIYIINAARKINAFEAGVPKSFSINVAAPIATAKITNNSAVNLVEKSIFLIESNIE